MAFEELLESDLEEDIRKLDIDDGIKKKILSKVRNLKTLCDKLSADCERMNIMTIQYENTIISMAIDLAEAKRKSHMQY